MVCLPLKSVFWLVSCLVTVWLQRNVTLWYNLAKSFLSPRDVLRGSYCHTETKAPSVEHSRVTAQRLLLQITKHWNVNSDFTKASSWTMHCLFVLYSAPMLNVDRRLIERLWTPECVERVKGKNNWIIISWFLGFLFLCLDNRGSFYVKTVKMIDF